MKVPNMEHLSYLALSSVSAGIILTDSKGQLYMNKFAERLTGWNNEQAAGKTLDEVFVVYMEGNRKNIPFSG